MESSLQKISQYIPESSAEVKKYFDKATTPNEVPYTLFSRYCFYAPAAIGCSMMNVVGYGLPIASHLIINGIVYKHRKNLTDECRKDAAKVFNSFTFVVAMTAYLFLSTITFGSFPIKLEKPSKDPDHTPPGGGGTDGNPIQPNPDPKPPSNDQPDPKEQTLLLPPENPNIVVIESKKQPPSSENKTNTQTQTGTPGPQSMEQSFPLPVIPVTLHSGNDDPSTQELNDGDYDFNDSLDDRKPLSPAQAEEADLRASSFEMITPSQEIKPPGKTMFELSDIAVSLKSWITCKIKGSDNALKAEKYYNIMSQLKESVNTKEGRELYEKIFQVADDSPLKNQCIELYKIINEPNQFKNIREQYQAFVLALREARKPIMAQPDPKKNIQARFGDFIRARIFDRAPIDTVYKPLSTPFKEWVEFLALKRFTGIKLFDYCKKLVEELSGKFNKHITLESFVGELKERIRKIQKIPPETGITWFTWVLDKLKGHFNWKDFLLTSNISYIYGQITIGLKTFTILRHGTPIIDSTLFGGGAAETPDYNAFIEGAKSKEQKIVQIILENGVEKDGVDKLKGGEESHRVKVRLALGETHENFYPLALRLDGHFVKPVHNSKEFKERLFSLVKNDFANQMYGEDTGYTIPLKVQEKGLTRKEFNQIMEKVHNTYFNEENKFTTLQDYQAFIVLTYAEMILTLCNTIDPTYLEVFCKDDIDRGGAMKAVLILVHLYRTGKFEEGYEAELSEALENLMVNLTAPSLIIRKDEIIESRADFVVNVIEVLLRTVKEKKVPVDHYKGDFKVLSHETVPVSAKGKSEQE